MTIDDKLLDQLLTQFEGIPIEHCPIDKYQKTALSFFHDKEFVLDPHLSITTQLDFTEARSVYDRYYSQEPRASFQIYLSWNLSKALKSEWCFSTRKIGSQWYLFNNLPIYFPMLVDEEVRFKDIFVYDVAKVDWKTFVFRYRDAMDRSDGTLGSTDPWIWAVSDFIGNLPYLNFTSVHDENLPITPTAAEQA